MPLGKWKRMVIFGSIIKFVFGLFVCLFFKSIGGRDVFHLYIETSFHDSINGFFFILQARLKIGLKSRFEVNKRTSNYDGKYTQAIFLVFVFCFLIQMFFFQFLQGHAVFKMKRGGRGGGCLIFISYILNQ